jgi:competence protein ComFB
MKYSFAKRYDLERLVNEAERLVVEELERQLKDREGEGICDCEECVLDMAACALNVIKPMYRATLLGTLYAHAMESGEYAAEVKDAVKSAIDRIKENPSHD